MSNFLDHLKGMGPVLTSVLTLSLFGICLFLAYYTRNEQGQSLMIGAVIAMAQTAVGFYLGSSRSSQSKDETIKTLAINNTAPGA